MIFNIVEWGNDNEAVVNVITELTHQTLETVNIKIVYRKTKMEGEL